MEVLRPLRSSSSAPSSITFQYRASICSIMIVSMCIPPVPFTLYTHKRGLVFALCKKFLQKIKCGAISLSKERAAARRFLLISPQGLGVQALLRHAEQRGLHHRLIRLIGNPVPLIRGGQHLHSGLLILQQPGHHRRQVELRLERILRHLLGQEAAKSCARASRMLG